MKYAGIAVLAAALAACSTSGTAVRIGEKSYSATQPDAIVMLVAPPERKHEVIALVEGTAATDDYFTKERTEAAAMKAMREKAASLGANAIVLTAKGSKPYGQVYVGNTVGSARVTGNMVSGYATSTGTSMGWEKITFAGTAVRYTDGE